MEVHALPIPSAQAMNGKGVTQIIRSRSDSTCFRFQTGRLKQKSEGAGSSLHWKPALVDADEKARVRVRFRVLHAQGKVSVQFSGQGAMKGNPAGPPFECIYEEYCGLGIDISQAQAERFSKPNSGAVQDENQRSVQCGSKARALQISTERQKIQNVLFGK